MTRALVIGGANGVGLSIAINLANRDNIRVVYVVDKVLPAEDYIHPKIQTFKFDLSSDDYSFFDNFSDIDALFITAGFGRLALFEDVIESYIVDSFSVNAVAPIRIVHRFMNKLASNSDFYCAIMGSISGFMSSPFFAVYGATKAALKIFIESVNVELEKQGYSNKILNVSPGTIKGTSFNQGKTELSLINDLAAQIITHVENKNDLFIPQYEEIYKNVLQRYYEDFRAEGRHSYDYKLSSGRLKQ